MGRRQKSIKKSVKILTLTLQYSLFGTMRIDVPGATYFMTTTTKKRVRIFQNHHIIALLAEIIRNACSVRQAVLHAYAIMPDHYHFIATLNEDGRIAKLMQSINSFFSHEFGAGKIDVWKDRPWDEVVRDEDMFCQKMQYVLLLRWPQISLHWPLGYMTILRRKTCCFYFLKCKPYYSQISKCEMKRREENSPPG